MDSKPGNSNNLDSETAISSNIPPTVYIRVQNPVAATPNDKHFEKTFPKKVVIILSSLQMIAFALAFISQIVLFAVVRAWLLGLQRTGAGIWCGFLFGISGGVGLFAAYRPSCFSFISFMVMSMISAFFCLPLMIIALIDATTRNYEVALAFDVIQIIVALSMAIVALISSALSCQAIFCRKWIIQGSVSHSATGVDGQLVTFQGLQPGAMPLDAAYPSPMNINESVNDEADFGNH